MKFIDRFLSFENKLLFKYKLEKNQGKTSVDSRESSSPYPFLGEGKGNGEGTPLAQIFLVQN